MFFSLNAYIFSSKILYLINFTDFNVPNAVNSLFKNSFFFSNDKKNHAIIRIRHEHYQITTFCKNVKDHKRLLFEEFIQRNLKGFENTIQTLLMRVRICVCVCLFVQKI